MKKPSYLNFSEEQNQNRKSTIQDLLGFAAVGGAGYAGYKSFNSPKEIASALSNLNKPSELRQAGETIGSEIKKSQEIAEQVRRANLDSFVQNLNNRLDDILDASSDATPEERRTFFASFFETVKNEELGTGIDSTDELIKKGYEDISSLDDNQKQVLKDLFNQQIQGSEKNSRRFSSSYKKYEANIGLFSESTDRQVTSTLSQRKTINLNSLASNTDYAKISSKYNELVNLAKGSGATVSLEEVDEGGVKGIYARFNKGSSSETLVLRSGRDKFGNPIVRAGESLQTRYVAPLKVLNAPELVDTRSLRSVKAGNLQQAMNAGMVVDYDDYIFNTFKNRVGGRTGFANFTSRDFVGLNQLIRAPAMYAPDEKGLSPTMENTVGTSRKMFSSSFLIAGLEQFNPKDRAQVNKVLLQAFPQDFAGVSSVQTMVRTYDDPFQRGASLSYSKLGYTGSDAGDINSPFKFLKFYGRDSIDRAVQKQTAREYQMVGREEGISIIRNSTGNYVGSFGVGDSIKTVTGGEDLIGINKEFYGKAAGMNLGGVIFKKRAVDKLGLAEGVAYFGGKIISEQTSTKTINPIGIAETKLFKKLKEKQKQGSIISVGESPTDLNSNYYNIDDFFKEFGSDTGDVILGENDTGFSKIERRSGMRSFNLQLIDESGGKRPNYKISMNSLHENTNAKLFGFAVKDTTQLITDSDFEQKLDSINMKDFKDYYLGSSVGGNLGATLVTGSDQLKKSSTYVSNFMIGGFKQIGGDVDALEQEIGRRIRNDNDYLNEVNRRYGTNYKTLDEVPTRLRSGIQLLTTAESIIKVGKNSFLDSKSLGHIIGVMEDFTEGKAGRNFGLIYGEEKNEKNFFEELLKSQDAALRTAAKSDVAFGVTYATTGGVHSELKRNLARMEPRAFNYMYTSLRSNLGLSSEEATKYMSSLIGRMEGAYEKSMVLPGMTTAQMGLSEMNQVQFDKYVTSISGVQIMDDADISRLFSLGQGNEEEIANLLSKYSSGSVIDLNKVISDPKKLKEISERLGGRSKIYLGGGELFDNLSGFSLKSGEQLLNIENEYTRSVTDLISSISSIRDSRSETELQNRLQQFRYAKKYMADITGRTIRQSLSGRVKGSGSYMGSGIILGKEPKFATLSSNKITDIGKLTEAFEKNKGYVVFQDAQAFLDGMTTYKDGLKGPNKTSRTNARVRNFFLGMHTNNMEAVTAMVMRNPNINMTHFLPSIGLMRYDFNRGNQDEFFKMFRGESVSLINFERVNEINERLKGKYDPSTGKYAGGGLFDQQKESRKKRIKGLKSRKKELLKKLNAMNPANIRRLLYAHLDETGIAGEMSEEDLQKLFGDKYDSLREHSKKALEKENEYLKRREEKLKSRERSIKDPISRKELQLEKPEIRAELKKINLELSEIKARQKELSGKKYSITKTAMHDALLDYYDQIFGSSTVDGTRTKEQESFFRKLSSFSGLDMNKPFHAMRENRAYKGATITSLHRITRPRKPGRIFINGKVGEINFEGTNYVKETHPASILYDSRYRLSERGKVSKAIMEMLTRRKSGGLHNIDLFQSLIGDDFGDGFFDLQREVYNPSTDSLETKTTTLYDSPKVRELAAKLGKVEEHLEIKRDADGNIIHLPNSDEIQKLLDERTALLDENITGNKISGDRLNILESRLGLGIGSLTSFEDVANLYESRKNDIIQDKSGKNITVGDEIDRYFGSMLRAHQNFGTTGGGQIYFPQMDVKAKLTAGGKTFDFAERIDFSRMMIGDFDADYYQVFHDTEKFADGVNRHYGLYKAGAEYLIHKELLGEGMSQLGKRLGVENMGIGKSALDEFEKEKIIKEVGGLDVQVKIGMLGAIRAAEENSLKTGGQEYMSSSMRSVSSLVAVAQEVLAIKGKSLPTAANVAESFTNALKESYKSGSGDSIFRFFEENVFKGTLLETGDTIKVSDIEFMNLPDSLTTTQDFKSELSSIEINTAAFREDLNQMARNVKKYGYEALGSDSRLSSALGGDIASVQLLNRMLTASAEGGMFNSAGEYNLNQLESISRNTNQILDASLGSFRTPKNVGGLLAGVLGGSYLVGMTSSISSLELSDNNFSDIRASQNIGNKHISQMFENRDHSGNIGNLAGSGYDSTFYQRPINQGESMVIKNNRTRFYGEAATYSEAAGSAQRFTSAGGKAFIGIQDNRMPISNAYINKSLRD